MAWSRAFLRSAMNTPEVRRKLRDGAEQIAVVARGIAQSEGSTEPVEVSEGIRPLGRPYARISMPGSAEWGDGKTPRLRILGRAATQTFPASKIGWQP